MSKYKRTSSQVTRQMNKYYTVFCVFSKIVLLLCSKRHLWPHFKPWRDTGILPLEPIKNNTPTNTEHGTGDSHTQPVKSIEQITVGIIFPSRQVENTGWLSQVGFLNKDLHHHCESELKKKKAFPSYENAPNRVPEKWTYKGAGKQPPKQFPQFRLMVLRVYSAVEVKGLGSLMIII